MYRPVEAAIAPGILFVCIEILHARPNSIGMTYHVPWLVAFGVMLVASDRETTMQRAALVLPQTRAK